MSFSVKHVFAIACAATIAALLTVLSADATSEGYHEATADRMVISESILSGTQPAVALDIWENSHMVWKNGADIWYARVGKTGAKLTVDDQNQAVAALKIYTMTSAINQPRVAVDSLGNAHVAIAGTSGIVYVRIENGGSTRFSRTIRYGTASASSTFEFRGVDIAIDPTNDLPVFGTLFIKGWYAPIDSVAYFKYQEAIHGIRIDANGYVTGKERYAWSEATIGGPPGRFEPPAIAVDPHGTIHAVWKCREMHDGSHQDDTGSNSIDPNANPNQGQAQKYWLQNIHGVAWKKGDRTLAYSNSTKAAVPVNILTIFMPDLISRIIPVRINTPNDVDPGTYNSQPVIAVDAAKNVHVVWAGQFKMGAEMQRAILYSRLKADGAGNNNGAAVSNFGRVEVRSRVISSKAAVIPPQTPGAALVSGALHVVWQDTRSDAGARIWHGAVQTSSSMPIYAAEYPISSKRPSTTASFPRIAFRRNKVFKEWTGYSGDSHNPALDQFDKNAPSTVVNLYNTDLSLTATYHPFQGGMDCPDDRPITLTAHGDGNTAEKVYISADNGIGGYSVAWQENAYDRANIALHRNNFRYGAYGLWTHYKRNNAAVAVDDFRQAMSENNRINGNYVDEPVALTNSYHELVRDSNFHPAQGLIADGVTPLLLRCELPVGEYYMSLKGGEGEVGGVPGYLQLYKVKIYNHNLGSWQPMSVGGPHLNVPAPSSGAAPREALIYIEGFEHSDPDVGWPAKNSRVPLEMRFFRKPTNGMGLDMVNDTPFATAHFTVAPPPVILVHGFNAASEGWTREFKQEIAAKVGIDFLLSVDYGQEDQLAGILGEIFSDLQNRMAQVTPGLHDNLQQISADANYFKENIYDSTKTLHDNYVSPSVSLMADVAGFLDDSGLLNDVLLADVGGDINKYLEQYIGSGDFHSFLGWIKKATYWEKKANAAAPLETLAKELSMRLYALEESIRLKQQWAMTRYDVVGHCQGGVLLAMLCHNKENGSLTSYLHARNSGRGRFHRVITIGSPHRGSRLTSYARIYQDEMLLKFLESGDMPADMLGFGTGLLFYAGYTGYLEPKWDAFIGDITDIYRRYPVHPAAPFHLVSSVIDHDHYLVKRLFGGIGLHKDAPITTHLFKETFPPYTEKPTRVSDGLVDWRSHFGGVDYRNEDYHGMLSSLDEMSSVAPFAAHIPPIPLTKIIGEPPGPPSFKDLYEVISTSIKSPKEALKTAALNMIRKLVDDKGVTFSLFGTKETQTNSVIIANHVADLLKGPESIYGRKIFGSFVPYDPALPVGNGNPEGWDSLGQQRSNLENKVQWSIKQFINTRESEYLIFQAAKYSRSTTEPERNPNQYSYRLAPPPEYEINGDIMWQALVVNGLVSTEDGVSIEIDPSDQTTVTVTVDPESVGHVYLRASFWSTNPAGDGVLVQISPVLVTVRNMGTLTGMHFREYVPILQKGQSRLLIVQAEYSSGMIGALSLNEGQSLNWSTSNSEVVAVTQAGKITAGNRAGTAVISVVTDGLSASMEISVQGIAPEARLTQPSESVARTAGEDIELEADVSDADGTVANVTFFANGVAIGQSPDISSPYSLTWTDITAGNHEIYAVAVDNDGMIGISNSFVVQVASRPPVIVEWPVPVAEQWYSGNIYCSVTAMDPDGDDVTVQFEYSLDSTDGINGTWSQCYYPLTTPPFDFTWASRPLEGVDDEVWLRVQATDANGLTSEAWTRRLKIDNSVGGLYFSPHPGESGIAITVNPTVTFEDPIEMADGSTLTDADLQTFFSFSSNNNQPVSCTMSISTDKRVVTIVPGSDLKGVTPYTVALHTGVKNAVTGAALPAASASFTTTHGIATALRFVRPPQNAVAGAVWPFFRVAVVDSEQNTVLDAEAPVTVSLVAAADVTLTGTAAVTALNGVAQFDDISTTTAATLQLTASSPGLEPAVAAEVAVLPAALQQLAVELPSTTAVAGSFVSPKVTAYDIYENVKTDYQGTPVFSSSDSSARLPNLYTFYLSDNGTRSYAPGVRFRSLGEQWLKVKDGKVESAPVMITVTNAPPAAPTPLSPVAMAYTGLAPLLRCGPFVDEDDAGFAGMQWQVAEDESFSVTVWDSGEIDNGTSATVPAQLLSPWTTYCWRARVRDASGDAETEWSSWSRTSWFKTARAFPFFDDFSEDKGWHGYSAGGWARGPAQATVDGMGNPGPAVDASPSSDNMLLGYNIGGNVPPFLSQTSIVSPPVDCSDEAVVQLSFQRFLGLEGSDWAKATVEASNDGKTWTRFWSNPATGTKDIDWTPVTFDLTPVAAGEPTVFVRFTLGPLVQAYPYCGWNIDDVELSGGDLNLATIILAADTDEIHVGDIFRVNIYVQENSAEAEGFMGGALNLDFPETHASFEGGFHPNNLVRAPFDMLRSGNRFPDRIENLGGLTSAFGHGDGTPVLFAVVPFRATQAGSAVFYAEPSASGVALASPVGQIGPWRVAPVQPLILNIEPAVLQPLVRLFLEGPTTPVPLHNTVEIKVFVQEDASNANGFLGGPFDLNFDPSYLTYPNFDPANIIQPPFQDIGIVSGTLAANRLDELGGATLASGYGNSRKVLYAVLTFQAENIGDTVLNATPGSTGLALTSPVGQVDFARIDYGLPLTVQIRQNYQLTIDGGNFLTGNGNYVAGEEIAISANAPAIGMQFSGWTGDIQYLSDAAAANPLLTVPASDITLTANYENIAYTLLVNGGSGSTTTAVYQQQLPITAHAPATGKSFAGWTGDVQYLADPGAASTVATMPANNVTVTANYSNIPYVLTVNHGTGTTAGAIYQQQIQITANQAPIGMEFAGWSGDVEYTSDPFNATTSITMPAANITLTAVYRNLKYTLTVVNGTGDTDVAVYAEAIQIEAEPAARGKKFDGWTGDVQYLADPGAATTTVTMPAQNVSVSATYVNVLYSLVVESGSGSTNTAIYGQLIPISAANPPQGQTFDGWTGHIAYLDNPYAASTAVTMPDTDIAVTATYSAVYALIVTGGSGDGFYRDGDIVAVSANVPADGQTFSGWGGDIYGLTDSLSPDTNYTMSTGHVAIHALYTDGVEIRLVSGWNLIGMPRRLENPADLAANDGLISGPVWGWDGHSYFDVDDNNPDALDDIGNLWHEAGYLSPNHGYWIYSPQGGPLQLQ